MQSEIQKELLNEAIKDEMRDALKRNADLFSSFIAYNATVDELERQKKRINTIMDALINEVYPSNEGIE